MRDDTAFETCQIVFWRGYVKCAFYAMTTDGEPVGSPFFRSRERSPMQSGAALEAHRALVERLEGEGWEPVARGRAWYALTCRRRVWSPVEDDPPTELPAVEAHAASAQPPLEPEPAPPPDAGPEPLPSPRAAARLRSRRQIALLLAAAVSIALVVVLSLNLYGANSAHGESGTAVRPANLHQAPRVHDRSPAVTVAPPRPAPTTIVVSGSRGDSWMEAKAGSATGKLLFAGVVSQGETVRVTAPIVWITFGAAGNLDVRVNGRAPVPGTFNGTVTAVIAHGQVRSA